MGDTSVAYRGGDFPVQIDGTFIPRVQDVSLNRTLGVEETYELGNEVPAGLDDGPDTYTGSLTWFPLNMAVERALTGNTGNVTWKEICEATGVDIETLTKSVTAARVNSLEYSCDAQGKFSGRAQFAGTGWSTTGATAITATVPTGVGAYSSPKTHIEMGTIKGVRVQSLRLAVGSQRNELHELSTEAPAGVVPDRPTIELAVTWYRSTNMTGEGEIALASPAACEIQVGSATWDAAGNVKHILYNMVTVGDVERGSVNGWATYSATLRSKGHSTTWGLETSIITT